MKIWGDYTSNNARQLRIRLQRCIGKDYCKPLEAINAFLRDKYLLMLHNEIRFDATQYYAESIIAESRTHWFQIKAHGHVSIPLRVTKTHIDLQDYHINLDDLTELEQDTLFKFESIATQEYDSDEAGVMDISIERNLAQKHIIRQTYGALDFLSDIGGMQSVLYVMASMLLSFVNYRNFETFMASRLFKLAEE